MTTVRNNPVRKRPVNLTLSEDLLMEAKGMTNNLSAVVESLLTAYVAKQHDERRALERQAEATTGVWNAFNDRAGSFADEYSTL